MPRATGQSVVADPELQSLQEYLTTNNLTFASNASKPELKTIVKRHRLHVAKRKQAERGVSNFGANVAMPLNLFKALVAKYEKGDFIDRRVVDVLFSINDFDGFVVERHNEKCHCIVKNGRCARCKVPVATGVKRWKIGMSLADLKDESIVMTFYGWQGVAESLFKNTSITQFAALDTEARNAMMLPHCSGWCCTPLKASVLIEKSFERKCISLSMWDVVALGDDFAA